jgi:ABC-2 type transport system ATP-binding protein
MRQIAVSNTPDAEGDRMLEARGLVKRYGSLCAVDDVSFTVRPSEVLGYLGPNGSGKSTTVGMLVGLVQPTRGHVLFDGRDIWDDIVGYRRRVGYVPEEPSLYPYLTAREYLELIGRLRGLPERLLDRRITALLGLFSLEADSLSPLSSYSKGMRQKVLISAALLHDPDLLVFDEPMSGLDAGSAMVFRHLVKALARGGKTVLYSSHELETVERVADRVVVLHQGRMVAHDSVERLRALMQLESLEDIFSQLVVSEDPEAVAGRIVDAVSSRS